MPARLFAKISAVGLALLALLLSPLVLQGQVGPPNNIACNQWAQVNVTSSTPVQLVGLAANQRVNICGWHITTTATAANNTFQFEYGTGTVCATGTTTFTPAINVSSTAPSADHIDYASYSLPLANALCFVAGGTTIAITGVVFYSQQ